MRRNPKQNDFKKPCRRFNQLNEVGMTLIEIMIVLVILGGLMAVLGKTVMDRFEKSRVNQAKITIKELEKELQAYNADCGRFPTTEEGFKALMSNPGSDACPNWGPKPYLKKEMKDPWNRSFQYESDGSNMNITSLGKDGKPGGSDYDADISLDQL